MRRGADTQTQTAVTNIHHASATPHAICNKSSIVAEMGDRLATIDGRKSRGIGEGRKPKQLQGTSTDVEWPFIASLMISLEGKI